MSWNRTPPDVRTICERTLNQQQLEVLKLKMAGLGYRRIAVSLTPERDPKSIRDMLDRIDKNLRRHNVHPAGDGTYHLERKDTAA